MTPVFFDAVGYSIAQEQPVEVGDEKPHDVKSISGTFVRDLISTGEPVPAWCMSPEISEFLLDAQSSGRPLFEEP